MTSRSRSWGWLGLLAAALFGLGAVLGRGIADAIGFPAWLGGLVGAVVGFLLGGALLRRLAPADD